jgi:hypothetical protein
MHRALYAVSLSTLMLTAILGGQSSPTDKIFLKDGQVLSGRLVADSFHFNTIYGNVSIPNSACFSLERKDERVEILVTINRERITGYLADPSVTIELSGGSRVPVAKELVQRLVFTERRNTVSNGRDYFQMKNGDNFYGTVLDESLQFTTSYGTLDTRWASLLKLEDSNGQTTMDLSDGSSVKGYLASPSIRVTTNYGFSLAIPKSAIKVVQLQR